MNEKSIGYYIVEPAAKPLQISFDCEKLLTISQCICNIEPDLSGCFWQGHNTEKEAYRRKLKLSQEEFSDLQKYITKLFDKHCLDIDGRFVNYTDAVTFYKRFLPDNYDAKLLHVFLSEKDIDILDYEMNERNAIFPKSAISQGIFLGRDMIGYDCGRFHSYLCNGLEKDICRKHIIKINPIIDTYYLSC